MDEDFEVCIPLHQVQLGRLTTYYGDIYYFLLLMGDETAHHNHKPQQQPQLLQLLNNKTNNYNEPALTFLFLFKGQAGIVEVSKIPHQPLQVKGSQDPRYIPLFLLYAFSFLIPFSIRYKLTAGVTGPRRKRALS